MNLLSIAQLVWMIIIIVQSSDQACEDGDVRLSGGRHYREGRVEVCRNQQWGRVCDDAWDENDSTVVCRQLGLSEEGAEIINTKQPTPEWYGPSTLSFFALDDVGCNGTESNLLDCLPNHNCGMDRGTENAGVQCLRRGVKLEYGSNQERNNTLFTVNVTQEDEKVLLCSTDRETCCFDELNIPGNWFLPNGTKIFNNQSLHITLGNQTVGLNITNSAELPTGIYHCEMMDRNNSTHHLYAGIYPEDEGNVTNIFVQYDRTSQTITCTSTGGPATDVTWSKDNVNIRLTMGDLYEHSQIIINTTSATYENKLKIVDKSSEAAGNYTCSITNSRGGMNGSLYIKVCRDMEFRVNNASSGDEGTVNSVEVCIDDQWHKTTAKITNNVNSSSPQNISVQENFTSMVIIWSPSEHSIPNDNNISGYSVLCIASSLSDHGHIHEVRVSNISTSTTRAQVSGLLPGTAYQCCVNAHIQTNTPLDLINSNCVDVSTKTIIDVDTVTEIVSTEAVHVTNFTNQEGEVTSTRNEFASNHHDYSSLGLGIGLGVACLLLMGSIVINIIFLTMHLKNNATKSIFKPSCTNELYEESDSEHDERLVGNPIYGDALPGENEDRASEGESYDVLHRDVQTVEGVTPTGIIYEVISNLQPSQPNRASDGDTETLRTGADDDDASVYAKLGAVGMDQ